MKLGDFSNRLEKIVQAMRSPRLLRALFFHRVLAASEHRAVLIPELRAVVDIGANRGQFALAARRFAPQARVFSFEPLPLAAALFRQVFRGDDHVVLHQAAVGPESETRQMHVSSRDDSSSLLPISALQVETFPGTEEAGVCDARVAPLDAFLCADDLPAPAMLKLDVQGFEYEALKGCESLLGAFDRVYCECSFVEFYCGQKLAPDVIEWLAARGFEEAANFNHAFDRQGAVMQADFLFTRREGARRS